MHDLIPLAPGALTTELAAAARRTEVDCRYG
jgi:hypothetical protein